MENCSKCHYISTGWKKKKKSLHERKNKIHFFQPRSIFGSGNPAAAALRWIWYLFIFFFFSKFQLWNNKPIVFYGVPYHNGWNEGRQRASKVYWLSANNAIHRNQRSTTGAVMLWSHKGSRAKVQCCCPPNYTTPNSVLPPSSSIPGPENTRRTSTPSAKLPADKIIDPLFDHMWLNRILYRGFWTLEKCPVL